MNIIVGVNGGSYTVNADTRQITLSDLYFTPSVEGLYYLLNITQDRTYYAAAQTYTKDATLTADGSNWILEYSSIFPVLNAGDKLHIQFECASFNHICSENTTNIPLGAGATFTGDWQDCINYQEVNISIATDKDSATNGLVIEWSSDGVTVGDDDKFTVYANAGTNYTPNPAFRYVRVKYTNGATPQTVFNLMTILRTTMTGGSFHRIDSTLKDDSDARLNITIPKLKTAANTYVSQQATTQGNAKISLEELEEQVSVNSNTQLKTTVFDSSGIELNIDVSTGSICVEDYSHCEIHSGDHYFVKDWVDLTNGQVLNFLAVTPNTTKWIHMIVAFNFEAEANVVIYEGTISSNNGTPVTTFNRNRNSINVAGMTMFTSPTIVSDGTPISRYKAGSGIKVGGEDRANQELVLKQNTKYLIRVTNDTVTNNWFGYLADWYEHQNLS